MTCKEAIRAAELIKDFGSTSEELDRLFDEFDEMYEKNKRLMSRIKAVLARREGIHQEIIKTSGEIEAQLVADVEKQNARILANLQRFVERDENSR